MVYIPLPICRVISMQMILSYWHTDFKYYSGSVGLSVLGSVDSDGRKTRYKAGPKNGTNDNSRSQDPLSNLPKISVRVLEDLEF